MSDQDIQTVKNKDVIDVNSSGDIVCRHYDTDGYSKDTLIVLDVFECICTSKVTEKI